MAGKGNQPLFIFILLGNDGFLMLEIDAMRGRFTIFCAVIAATMVTMAPADARPRMSGEEELAKLLKGRVAGPPQSCITTWPNSPMRTIDHTAYVFGSGNIIYVNRTRDPNSIDDDNIMVIRRFGSGTQLCNNDIITTMDRSSQIYTGNVFLSEFIPYRREK